MSDPAVVNAVCESCSKEFTRPKQRGECIAADKPQATESEAPIRSLVCESCEKEFTASRKGKAPKKCPDCRQKDQAEKEPNVCSKCDKEFEHSGRGRVPSMCPTCRDEDKKASPKRRTEEGAPQKKRTRAAEAAESDEASSQLAELTEERDKHRSAVERLEAENAALTSELTNWHNVIDKLKTSHAQAYDFLMAEHKKRQSV
ncbi:hypothetical protein RCL1_002635 [Eukaryota sp. TZLM3-RCL]